MRHILNTCIKAYTRRRKVIDRRAVQLDVNSTKNAFSKLLSVGNTNHGRRRLVRTKASVGLVFSRDFNLSVVHARHVDSEYAAVAGRRNKAPRIELNSATHKPLGVGEAKLHTVDARDSRDVAVKAFEALEVGGVTLSPARSACPRVDKKFCSTCRTRTRGVARKGSTRCEYSNT